MISLHKPLNDCVVVNVYYECLLRYESARASHTYLPCGIKNTFVISPPQQEMIGDARFGCGLKNDCVSIFDGVELDIGHFFLCDRVVVELTVLPKDVMFICLVCDEFGGERIHVA